MGRGGKVISRNYEGLMVRGNSTHLNRHRIKPLRNALPTKTKTLRVFREKNRFLSTLSGILFILRRRSVIITARKLAEIMLRPYFLARKSEVLVWLDKQLFLAQSLANFFDTIARDCCVSRRNQVSFDGALIPRAHFVYTSQQKSDTS